jgi:hypothetical protein
MFWPGWEQKSTVSVRHIPYSDTDDIQFGGLGNFQLTVQAEVSSSANVITLRGSVDGVARTLGDFRGNSYTNCYLTDISEIRAHDTIDVWTCKLTFMRTSNVSTA